MCEPISIALASAALGAAGQMVQYQNQQAMYEQNRQNAMAAFRDNQQALNTREMQEQTAASEKRFDMDMQAKAAMATADVSAGEAGVSGISVDQLIGDLGARGARAKDRIDEDQSWTTAQLQSEKTAGAHQMVDRINSVPAPNFADAALRIAGVGLNSASSYYSMTNKKAPTG